MYRWDELRALLLFRLKQVWLCAAAAAAAMDICPPKFELCCFSASDSKLLIKRDTLTCRVDSGAARFL